MNSGDDSLSAGWAPAAFARRTNALKATHSSSFVSTCSGCQTPAPVMAVAVELRARDRVRAIAALDAYARIADRPVGRRPERPAAPRDDDRVELGHHDARRGGYAVEHRAQREAHAEPADEHVPHGPVAEPGDREP